MKMTRFELDALKRRLDDLRPDPKDPDMVDINTYKGGFIDAIEKAQSLLEWWFRENLDEA
jgi:hypothetical protein